MNHEELRGAVRKILRAGLAAVKPRRLIRAHLRVKDGLVHAGRSRIQEGAGRLFVIAVGKAAIPMAREAHEILGRRIASAIVIAPQVGPRMPRTRVFKAGHPIPNAAGLRASQHVIRLLEDARRGDVVLLLLSGGASALMPAPVEGVSLRDKGRVTKLLLERGAAINELNAVRKQLSRLKGGGFARIAAPARVITLALSDVPGDDPGVIGSGPGIDAPLAAALARRTIRRLLKTGEIPPGVRRALRPGRPTASAPERSEATIIGSGATFAAAAATKARELGFSVRLVQGGLRGEARVCGPDLVARFERTRGRRPLCLIATGETVVTVRGVGRGGRNQELALSSVSPLSGATRPTVLAAFATDGKDGRSTAGGGLVDDRTAARAALRGVSVPRALARNDSFTALRRLGGLIATGPTHTNVADVAVVVG